MNHFKILPIIALSLVFLSLKQDNTAPVAKIQWHSLQEAQELMKKQPKKLFVDLYTDWCGWCKVMDRKTFTNDVVIELMNKYFYAVKFNAEKGEDFDFNGQTFKLTNRGNGKYFHEWAGAYGSNNGRMSYPTTIYFTEGLDKIQAIPGYHDAHEMEKILEYLGGGYGYRGVTYQQFDSEYKSRVPKPKQKPKGH